MARPRANLRLFVAAYPPIERSQRWLADLAELNLPPHRPTPLPQVHLTLLFIGDVPVRQLDRTIESIQRSCGGIKPITLTPQRLVALPDEKPEQPARLVAVQTDSPPMLLELQRRLAARLARKTRSRSGRAYRPHLTLCRFDSPASLDRELPAATDEPFELRTVHLMRSTLSPGGAEHHLVQSFELRD